MTSSSSLEPGTATPVAQSLPAEANDTAAPDPKTVAKAAEKAARKAAKDKEREDAKAAKAQEAEALARADKIVVAQALTRPSSKADLRLLLPGSRADRARSALGQAVVAVRGPRGPLIVLDGSKLDPEIAKLLPASVREARPPSLVPLQSEQPEASDPEHHVSEYETHEQTDLRNSERLVEQHCADLRYVPAWRKWIVFRGTHWSVEGDDGEATQRAVVVVRRMMADAKTALMQAQADWASAVESDGMGSKRHGKASDALDRARKAFAFAVQSQSALRLRAMVELAKSATAIRVAHDTLDTDPMLLNCPNGTVDLRTGLLRDHAREDMITKCTAATYDGRARSELWDRVLLESMGGDDELVSYFQRAAGYSCSGDTSEEKLFMPIGPTRGGKSTIVQGMVRALGDYARTADFEAFLAHKNTGGPKNEIARLAGARLVVSIEAEKGRKLAQSLIKTLTGGDVATARFLYSEAFEFKPQFKLWLVANDAPLVSDDDLAMWERIQRIPFPCTVPKERRDPNVKRELVDVQRSGAAILAWMVEGCLRWQAHGLGTAAAVTEATEEYRAEQDPLRDFMSEACLLAPTVQCSRRELRAAYERWVEEAGGREPMTGKDFTDRIRSLAGVAEKTVNGQRFWTGLGLMAARASQGARVHEGAAES